MGAKLPNPDPNRKPDGTIDTEYAKPAASPAPPPRKPDYDRNYCYAVGRQQWIDWHSAKGTDRS